MTAQWVYDGNIRGMPGSGSGNANSVDGVLCDSAGDVALGAVRYQTTQDLTAAQREQARENLGLGMAATQGMINDLNAVEAGNALDARQGKTLNDALAAGLAAKLDTAKGTMRAGVSHTLAYGLDDGTVVVKAVSPGNSANFDLVSIYAEPGAPITLAWAALYEGAYTADTAASIC